MAHWKKTNFYDDDIFHYNYTMKTAKEILIYSQTSVQRPSLALDPQKSGCCWLVIVVRRLFIKLRKYEKGPGNRGWYSEVVVNSGLTVFRHWLKTKSLLKDWLTIVFKKETYILKTYVTYQLPLIIPNLSEEVGRLQFLHFFHFHFTFSRFVFVSMSIASTLASTFFKTFFNLGSSINDITVLGGRGVKDFVTTELRPH